MTIERQMHSSELFEETILTIDEFGNEVNVLVSEIPELEVSPYHWGDSMVVTYSDNDEGEKS